MRRFTAPALLLFVAALVAVPAHAQKKRVAVLDFDYATVQSYISGIFGSNVDVGKGVRDQIVEKLVEAGTFSVIERAALDKILTEQNFSNSNRANPTSAADIGRILGVDAIIIGSITRFGRDDQDQSIGAGGYAKRTFGIGGFSKKKSKAVCSVTARIVDVNTAEILGVATGDGEAERKGTSILGAGGSGGAGGGGAYDMNSSNFHNTILGEAVRQSVEQTAAKLETFSDRVTARKIEIEGLIADYTDGVAVLNVGSAKGVKVGDVLLVKRPIREIKDPSTGRVIRRIENTLGELTVFEVDESSALAQFTGETPPKVGDVARSE